jgi:predicted DNA-binding transcriptional regulator YafY
MASIYTNGVCKPYRLEAAAKGFSDAGQRGLTRKGLQDKLSCNDKMADRIRKVLAHPENGARFEEFPDPTDTRVTRFVMKVPPCWYLNVTPRTHQTLALSNELLEMFGAASLTAELRKIDQIVNSEISEQPDSKARALADRIKVIPAFDLDPTANEVEILDTLLLSLSLGKRKEIRVSWAPGGQDIPARTLTVVPYQLTLDVRAGVICLLGWDPRAACARFFQLPEIKGVAFTGGVGTLPEPVLSRLHSVTRLQMAGAAGEGPLFQVKLRIRDPRLIWSLQTAQPNFSNWRLAQDRTGACLVEFSANQLDAACRWVLQLGGQAEVIGPLALRDEVLRHARMILANHGQP